MCITATFCMHVCGMQTTPCKLFFFVSHGCARKITTRSHVFCGLLMAMSVPGAWQFTLLFCLFIVVSIPVPISRLRCALLSRVLKKTVACNIKCPNIFIFFCLYSFRFRPSFKNGKGIFLTLYEFLLSPTMYFYICQIVLITCSTHTGR